MVQRSGSPNVPAVKQRPHQETEAQQRASPWYFPTGVSEDVAVKMRRGRLLQQLVCQPRASTGVVPRLESIAR